MALVVMLNNRSFFMPAPYVFLGTGDKKIRYNKFLNKLFRESLGMFGKLDKNLISEEKAEELDSHISSFFKEIPESQAANEWMTGLLQFKKSLNIIKVLCQVHDQFENNEEVVFENRYTLPKGVKIDIANELSSFIKEKKETLALISSYFRAVDLPKSEEKPNDQSK